MLVKKFRIVYFPFAFILICFIWIGIEAITRLIEVYDYNGFEFNIESLSSVLSTHAIFRAFLLILAPTLAVLFRSKLSWFIIITYFYFIISNTFGLSLFDITYQDNYDITYFIMQIVFIFISLFFVIIMNRRNVIEEIYNMELRNRNLLNIVALIFGFSISLVLIINRNSHYI